MANTYTTSKIVRLYDQRTPTKLLHPETELSAVVCTSGGLVVIADNNISVPASSVGAVISASGFIQEPILEATTGGTVTNIGTSTGYGTLLKTISTTETVRLPATSASNDYIPTELAVAVGLDRKQDVLSAGSFITLTPDGAGHDVIAVAPTTTEIRGGTAAVNTALPTEKAVQVAIGVASAAAVTEAMTSVGSAGYATQSWANATFLSSGGSHDWGYATNNAAGVVKPVANGGLVLGDNGALSVAGAPQYATYATASAGSAGLVRVTSEVVSAANATQSAITVVPTTDAVYRAIQAHVSPQEPISSGSGITVTHGGGSYTIALKNAGTNSLGGVMIPAAGGLTVANTGALSVAGATVQNSYVDAATVPYAGVRVLDEVTSTDSAALLAAGYVPSVQAVYDFVSGATAGISSWVTGNSYATITYVTNNFISQGAVTDWGSATTTSLGVAAFPANKGTTIVGGSVTLTAAPVTPLFASASALATAGNIGGVVAMNGMGTAGGTITTLGEGQPVVPTVRAVSAYIAGFTYATETYVQTHTGINTPAKYVTARGSTVSGGGDAIALGGIRIVMDTGIGVELTGDTAGNIYGIQATGTTFGMVKVPSANGLSVNGGTLSMARTELHDDADDARTQGVGGAVVGMSYIPYGYPNWSAAFLDGPYVPNCAAVAAYVSAALNAHPYNQDFCVESSTTTQDLFTISSGLVYKDGQSTSSTVGASSYTIDNPSTLWLQIISGTTFSYATSPQFSNDATSYPIAYISGGIITQYQYGPIIVRGRWA